MKVDAKTRFAVRKLGAAGVSAYHAGDYEGASEKLEKAYELMPVPSLGLWSARALVRRGLWTRAAERYLTTRRLDLGPGDPKIQRQALQAAAAERAALMPRIPSLRVRLEGARAEEVSVSVDGSPLPALLVGEDWPVDPGTHAVVGRRGSEQVEATSSVTEGEHTEVVLHFSTPPRGEPLAAVPQLPLAPPAEATITPTSSHLPAPAPNDAVMDGASPADGGQPIWRGVGWVSLGAGGAALLASTFAALVASQRHERWTSRGDCVGNGCVEALREEVEAYNRLVDLSTAGWISGAALLGGGIFLVLTFPAASGSVDVALGPASASVGGHF